jgi:hypothetical protein
MAKRDRIDSGSSFKDQIMGALFGAPSPAKKREIDESFYKIEKTADLQKSVQRKMTMDETDSLPARRLRF